MAFKIKNFYGSPLHSEGFTMDELNKKTKKEQIKSKAQASKLPQIEKPGFDYEMDQDMSYPGGERGRDYDEEGTKDGMSRKEAAYFGLGPDDGTARKTKKANKTAQQIVDMQKKRSSVKNVYLGDPDDLQGEMVRTADKPAGKREKRKVKKLKKTKDQLGVSRKASALNKNKLNRKERKMVRQHMKGGDVKPRNPFTEVDPKKVLTEINTRKKNKS